MKKIKFSIALTVVLFIFQCTSPTSTVVIEDIDPLPSWNDGSVKNSIIDFVTKTAEISGTEYIPVSDRIAIFDNDGTLWSEQPLYFQLYFAIDRVKALAPEHPEWKDQQPFKAVLENDLHTVMAGGERSLIEIVMATHAGNTTDEFQQIVSEWIKTAKHPKTGKHYTDMTYLPMKELLNYLKENGFQNYIVSGGGIEFMRPWTEAVYGIPPEQVIGSSIKTEFEMADGKAVLKRLPELDFIDDKEGKPIAINKFIGKQPIIAFGNSDGDLQMLQWTDRTDGPKLIGYIHHTDSVREWAYDRDSHVGRLDKGLDEAKVKNWLVVGMANDWKKIY